MKKNTAGEEVFQNIGIGKQLISKLFDADLKYAI